MKLNSNVNNIIKFGGLNLQYSTTIDNNIIPLKSTLKNILTKM
jgi:hypothetical protein